MNIKNIKKEKGYAILFAVILISIISTIVLGLSNTTYKQLVITSVSKDSQVAFYESDMATECGLYLDNNTSILSGPLPPSWTCGIASSGDNVSLNITQNPTGVFNVDPPTDSPANLPSFSIVIDKRVNGLTKITSKGYNAYDKTNFKTVERAIEISY
jgi:hypothetical protein